MRECDGKTGEKEADKKHSELNKTELSEKYEGTENI